MLPWPRAQLGKCSVPGSPVRAMLNLNYFPAMTGRQQQATDNEVSDCMPVCRDAAVHSAGRRGPGCMCPRQCNSNAAIRPTLRLEAAKANQSGISLMGLVLTNDAGCPALYMGQAAARLQLLAPKPSLTVSMCLGHSMQQTQRWRAAGMWLYVADSISHI
jgi:hypothetical protein